MLLNGKCSRRDIYGLRIKEEPEVRLKKLASDFQFQIPDPGKFEDENGEIDIDSYYREFKKEWLGRYPYYKSRYEILTDEIEYMRERGNRLVSRITGMPTGSSSSKPEDEWDEIIEYTDKAIDYLCTISENLLYTLLEIEMAIESLNEPELELILTMRYLRGMSIKEMQKKIKYSRSQIWKLEVKALDRIELEYSDKELKERMEKEYRRLEFEIDHFDPEKVDPDVLEEYMGELLEDRSEAAKIIDRNRVQRKVRSKNRQKAKQRRKKKEQEEELKKRKNRKKTGVIKKDS